MISQINYAPTSRLPTAVIKSLEEVQIYTHANDNVVIFYKEIIERYDNQTLTEDDRECYPIEFLQWLFLYREEINFENNGDLHIFLPGT